MDISGKQVTAVSGKGRDSIGVGKRDVAKHESKRRNERQNINEVGRSLSHLPTSHRPVSVYSFHGVFVLPGPKGMKQADETVSRYLRGARVRITWNDVSMPFSRIIFMLKDIFLTAERIGERSENKLVASRQKDISGIGEIKSFLIFRRLPKILGLFFFMTTSEK
jgi:hypothetical protein